MEGISLKACTEDGTIQVSLVDGLLKLNNIDKKYNYLKRTIN